MNMRCKKCNSVPLKDFEFYIKKAGLKGLDSVKEWYHSQCYPVEEAEDGERK